MQGSPERAIHRETDRIIYQPHTEFLQAGGRIRPADLEKDIDVVRDLFVQKSTIEHLADVTPDYDPELLREYYRTYPNSILLVAELPNEGVVGTVTVMKEEGLYSAKLNKLAVREDLRSRGIAYQLGRAGVSLSLEEKPHGFGVSQVFAAVIYNIEGYEKPIKVFEGLGFSFHGGVLFERCDGWSNKDQTFVKRDV